MAGGDRAATLNVQRVYDDRKPIGGMSAVFADRKLRDRPTNRAGLAGL